MNFSENIKDLGLLSELAYLKLENYEFSLNDIDNLELFISNKNLSGVDIDRIDDIEAILNKYDIKHFKSFSSGLQLMILEDKSNPGKKGDRHHFATFPLTKLKRNCSIDCISNICNRTTNWVRCYNF